MNRVRRFVLELFAILPTTAATAYLGPFGTYTTITYGHRCGVWCLLLLSAYVLARPTLLFWQWVARISKLPSRGLSLWGMVVSSAPIALIFLEASPKALKGLIGFGGMLPFALLSCILVMAIAWWAERLDARIAAAEADRASALESCDQESTLERPSEVAAPVVEVAAIKDQRLRFEPKFHQRLGASSGVPIEALQAEDHYVRVHKADGSSQLVLARLRDAITEMEGVEGRQVHRSWWVARDAIAEVIETQRTTQLATRSGVRMPVARDLAARLKAVGFLSSPTS